MHFFSIWLIKKVRNPLLSVLNSYVLVRDVSIAGEKTSFAAASAFSFRCTDCTSGATCNKWRADLIAGAAVYLKTKRFFFATSSFLFGTF